MRFLTFLTLGALTFSFAAVGCNDNDNLKSQQHLRHEDLKGALNWSGNARLVRADSCEQAEATFKAAAIKEMDLQLDQNLRCALPSSQCYYWGDDVADMENGAPSQERDESGGDGPDDYSETNTQVAGVDEADIVKTDGQTIVGLFGQDLVSMDAWPPADLGEASRIQIPGQARGFYLVDDQAIVLSDARGKPYYYYDDGNAPAADVGEPGMGADFIDNSDYHWPETGTIITVVNLAGNSATIESQHFIAGSQLDSRRIGNQVYLALTHPRYIPGLLYWPNTQIHKAPEDLIRRTFEELRQKNIQTINELSLQWWLPQRYAFDANGEIDEASQQLLTNCHDIYTSSAFAGSHSLLSVVTYDFKDDTLNASTIHGDWSTVYASHNAFYLAATNWAWNAWWGPQDSDAPEVLTQIHKFAFEENGTAQYRSSGAVEGYALNQFAFDENDDHLRVATTLGRFWWRNGESTLQSQVAILTDNDGTLETVGLVDGLGKGETIYAVRFMGDKGYVVTFRQIDPLYVLDLSDPAAPKAVGELEIPGYSTYMHPIEDDHLLTIGRDVDLSGMDRGLKLEIFDVRDPADPKSVLTEIIGSDWGTGSEALYDHKAFVYFAARKLLAIPVSGWGQVENRRWEYQSALHVFRISPTSITPLGEISHLPLYDTGGVARTCNDWSYWTQANVRRGIFMSDANPDESIGEYVYSVSNVGVLVHDVAELSTPAIGAVFANTNIKDALKSVPSYCSIEGTP